MQYLKVIWIIFTKEILLAVKHLELNSVDLKSIIIYGFKRSFFPGSYISKRAYVRKIIDYYEHIENQYRKRQPK